MKNNFIQKNTLTDWIEVRIRDIAEPVTILNENDKPYEVLSCTKYDGLVSSLSYFGRKVYGNDLSKYKIVPLGYFAYATNHIEEGSIGYQNFVDFGLVSPMYTVFRIKDEKIVNPLFLFHLLKSPALLNRYKSLISASVERRGGLRWKNFSAIKIILPPIDEQNKIVALEKNWRLAIDNIKNKIEIQQEVKDYLISNLLAGKVRIPGSNGTWKKMTLNEILYEHKEISSGSEEVHSVSVSKGIVNQIKHLGRSYAAKDVSNYKIVKPGDLVYTKSPTGGFPYGIVKQSKIKYKAIVSPLYGVFTPENIALGSIINTYFESQRNTERYLKPLIHKGAKNTMNITNKTFLSGNLYLPTDKTEQEEIAKLFTDISKYIDLLKQKLSLIKNQRKYLLDNLITGAIRTLKK